jgi:hypothetical protein
MAPAEPKAYTVEDYNIRFDNPPSGDFTDYPINIRLYVAIPALLESSDTTPVTFFNAMQFFVASRIETRRQNWDKAKEYMAMFENIVEKNVPKRDGFLKNKKMVYNYYVK